MLVGFIHRVMNIDNMSIAGETIDYGPCAFMDSYHRDTVWGSIDAMGRYAYGRQPRMAQWNLARFAETLLPHFPEGIDKAAALAPEAINDFIPRFEVALTDGLRGKLGLSRSEPGDLDLPKDLLARRVGFALTFWRLCDAAGDEEDGCAARVYSLIHTRLTDGRCAGGRGLQTREGIPLNGKPLCVVPSPFLFCVTISLRKRLWPHSAMRITGPSRLF